MFINYILLHLLLWFSDLGSFVWHHDIWCSWTLWWVPTWSVFIPFRCGVSVPGRSDWVDQVPKCNTWTKEKAFQSVSWNVIWFCFLVSNFLSTQILYRYGTMLIPNAIIMNLILQSIGVLCLSGFLIGTSFSEESSASIFELVCLFEMSVPMYKTVEHLSSED